MSLDALRRDRARAMTANGPVTSINAGPPARFATGREADLPSSSSREALDGPARHPLESITPVGLVMLFLLSICAGLVLAVVLKVLSMVAIVMR